MTGVTWWPCACASVALVLALAGARTYERCELARDLQRLRVSPDHLATWLCIAFHESRFDTAARNPYSGDHGLLQISELYWCGPGKVCTSDCAQFRDEDISDDVQCALRIHEEHTRLQGDGFLAWVVYAQHCKHNVKKYLADCDALPKNATVRTFVKQRALTYDNNSNSSYARYSNVDELKPPYLTIGSLYRASYGNELVHTGERKNWLGFKINDIDSLTLPPFKSSIDITTKPTTTRTVSTTSVPPIVSSKYKETNQFRDRLVISKTSSLVNTNSANNKSSYKSPVYTSVTPSPTGTTRKIAFTYPTTRSDTIPTSTRYPLFTFSSSQFTKPSTKTRDSTKSSQIYPRTFTQSSILPKSNTPSTTTSYSRFTFTLRPFTIPSMTTEPQSTTKFILNDSRKRTQPLSTKSGTFTSTMSYPRLNYTLPPFTRPSTTTVTPATTKFIPNYSRKLTQPLIQTKYDITTSTMSYPRFIFTSSPLIRPTTTTLAAVSTKTTTLAPAGLPKLSYTLRPWSTSAPPATTAAPGPPPTQRVRTAPPPFSFSTTTSRPTSTSPPKTTYSVFDLYLNPTRRPKVAAYNFPSLNGRYVLKIFSDGTTPAPNILKIY